MKEKKCKISLRVPPRLPGFGRGYSKGIYLFTYYFIFDYTALVIRVKDRACLKIATPVYCFYIFRSVSGVLFCFLDRKLILVVKPSDKV